ncbi:hypothetical protein DT076_17925 [Desertihabitans brevis]|uniref:DUF1801 domain-containing protein n=1 Tax=Desertihabitans brevis TaxID=2268447 RepID=A0A367YQA2_9ACTN|nr:hypothetical protein [Desertihabitans brevis]RCK68073.1 hypothetical protein DT076_17925 [Desertihabitans brevis]
MTTSESTGARSSEVFSDYEKQAMKERAAELKAQSGRRGKKDGEADVLAKIAEMPADERAIAEGLHALVKEVHPTSTCKTWYGMPAYQRDGRTIVFFQSATKMQTRYSTVAFDGAANLDDGPMWPTSFAVTRWDDAVAARVRELLERAFS